MKCLNYPMAGILRGAVVLTRKPNNTVHVAAYEHAVWNVYLQPTAQLYFPSLHATSSLRSLQHARHAVNICTYIINTWSFTINLMSSASRLVWRHNPAVHNIYDKQLEWRARYWFQYLLSLSLVTRALAHWLWTVPESAWHNSHSRALSKALKNSCHTPHDDAKTIHYNSTICS